MSRGRKRIGESDLDMGKQVCFVDKLKRGSPEVRTLFSKLKKELGNGPFPPLETQQVSAESREHGRYDYLVFIGLANGQRRSVPNTFLQNER